jgi:DNA-binding transcriptional regulator GbsR (MarR family)
VAAIRRNHELLRLLVYNQPLSTAEIQEEYYIPKDRLQRGLRQLLVLELVVKVNFERNVLYAINGNFNSLIKHTLAL